ncbi:hypothetical protein Pmani_013896 [Petrolisthes manimaculis]|uniref:Uncharacterized protein n=1 Tax=Petrolisthes manimaculis TaxID=1843537 RepID=A0AAE1PXJ0_9EUCA|nr:hypothetical protein Pmani_013896 [Petrolisthes manimaculis]
MWWPVQVVGIRWWECYHFDLILSEVQDSGRARVWDTRLPNFILTTTMADDLPSTSTGRRDFRGPSTTPAVSPAATPTIPKRTRSVTRKLDTSRQIRDVLDEIISSPGLTSGEDEMEGDHFARTFDDDFSSDEGEVTSEDEPDDSDPVQSDPDEPAPVSPVIVSPPPRQRRRVRGQNVLGPPQAASTPLKGHRPVPPVTDVRQTEHYRWSEVTEDDPFTPKDFVLDTSGSGVGQAVKDLPVAATPMQYFLLFLYSYYGPHSSTHQCLFGGVWWSWIASCIFPYETLG